MTTLCRRPEPTRHGDRLASVILLVASLFAVTAPLTGQDEATQDAGLPAISTATASDEERRTAKALEDVLHRWDLRPFVFVEAVVVAEGAIPRSHPVPVLNTAHSDDPRRLLALFLHEQLHHFEVPGMDYEGAVVALEQAFPDPPLAPPEGAVTRSGTYLHLIVCHLELSALAHLLGVEEARRLVGSKSVYRWVYRTVLEDPRIGEIAEAHGLTISRLLPAPGPRP